MNEESKTERECADCKHWAPQPERVASRYKDTFMGSQYGVCEELTASLKGAALLLCETDCIKTHRSFRCKFWEMCVEG